jgi:hypothetical protein
MNYTLTKPRKIAIALLIIIAFNILSPTLVFALTSGPAQPETKGFQPAGVSDMVDLQSGDFKYNIPLLDIDGYPINLNYASGTGMDEEASWVGLGWSLNPGAVNRQVRGVPDDMDGDQVETDHYTKPMVTVGGRLTAKIEVFGFAALKGSMTYGVYSNNYTGIGAELSANAGMSLSAFNSGMMTGSLGLGLSSNTQSGVDFSPKASLDVFAHLTEASLEHAGLSASLGYNTRSGLKALTLGASFSYQNEGHQYNTDQFGSSISYNTEPVNPHIQTAYRATSTTFSLDVGGAVVGLFLGGGLSGYRNVRKVLNETQQNPSYGFLYAEHGKSDPNALMDFIREKENPVIPELPNLAVPVQTPDLFSFSSQAGGGQFRLYRGGTGIFFDSQADDQASNSSFGGDIGLGAGNEHFGVTYFQQDIHNRTRKWNGDNDYAAAGDFQDRSTTEPAKQHVAFKTIGEKSLQNDVQTARLGYAAPVKIDLDPAGKHAYANFNASTDNTRIQNNQRQAAKTVVSFLTAEEAAHGGLDKNIDNYLLNTDEPGAPFDASQDGWPLKPVPVESLPRVDPAKGSAGAVSSTYPELLDANPDPDNYPVRKKHHISEVTVTDGGGKRLVYGVPVYNVKQDEYSFAAGVRTNNQTAATTASNAYFLTNTNQAWLDGDFGSIRPGTGKGIDHYYHKESKPPYATSYLLSAILSPDYVDKTGNGISDDDQGTATKFNYSKLPYLYKWRTPYQNATVNRGLLANPNDDKASIVYGEKEIWYVSSIETKTKIAYFITAERADGLGVQDWAHGGADPGNKQRYLKEIRLYSKASADRPIKVVKFEYDYSLCRGVPNSVNYNPANLTANNSGKLTLKKVWFEYGNVTKGADHPYRFTYQDSNNPGSGTANPSYANMMTDRWGVYKDPSENIDAALSNEDFPYTNQLNRTQVDKNAALWHLTQVDLPTGGTIKVNYESDDYAYVQDRKAMTMVKFNDLVDATGASVTELRYARGLTVQTPTQNMTGDVTDWFKKNYLDGSDYLYTKLNVHIATDNVPNTPAEYTNDFIPCYAKVTSVHMDSGGLATIQFETINQGGNTNNPIIMAAWQRLKNDYPEYAYPGYQNRTGDDENSGLTGVISATINAAGNVAELVRPFYAKAYANHYADYVEPHKSFIRLAVNTTHTSDYLAKLGGGVRVKQISISDNWQAMSGNTMPAGIGTYGQSYDYSTTLDGQLMSSGVATYEPSIGSDENPFRQPVPYIQNIKGGIDNYMDLEEPFGESVFPAPTVTYSKVTVTDLDKGNVPAPGQSKTGQVVNEFYTSKEYPVLVDATPITTIHATPSNYFTMVKTASDDELTMSQGYCIQLNDMNGKPKAVRVLNQAGAEVSATEYTYKSKDNGRGSWMLDNQTKVVNPDGSLAYRLNADGSHNYAVTLGQDVEFFTDFREQESSNRGLAINIGTDIIYFFVAPHIPININDDYRLFRSACTFKVVQSYALIDKVVKRQNGSAVTSQELAYDGVTGDPIVASTTNEFNRNIYTVSVPAYWGYQGMGPAYQSQGTVLSGLTTDFFGILGSDFNGTLQSGDELLDVATGAHFWVIQQSISGTPAKLLVDRSGSVQRTFNPGQDLLKVIRSGRRNLLGAPLTSIVCLNNPIGSDNRLIMANNADLTQALKVINASSSSYSENWAVETPNFPTVEDHVVNWHLTNEGTQNGSFQFDGLRIAGIGDFAFGGYATGYVPTGDTYNRILACRIVPQDKNQIDNGETMDLYSTFVIPGTQSIPLLIGHSATEHLRVSFDCGAATPLNDDFVPADGSSTFHNWTVEPVSNTLLGTPVLFAPGRHVIHLQLDLIGVTNTSSILPSAGIELYNNTAGEVYNNFANDGIPINIVFSTAQFVENAHNLESYTNGFNTWSHYSYANNPGVPVTPCNAPPVNPYVSGFQGNWRLAKTKVFQQSRANNGLTSAAVNVPNAGYINGFYPAWYTTAGATSWTENTDPTASRWTTANTVTQYDKYGQQVENRDALNRYSAAQFDFKGELPSAVASNAMSREIYANTFEGVFFSAGANQATDVVPVNDFKTPNGFPFGWYDEGSNNGTPARNIAHTGNYAAILPTGGVTMVTDINNSVPGATPYLTADAQHQYIKTTDAAGLYPNGFEPRSGKKYIFDTWVKDGSPNDKSVHITLQVNGSAVPLQCKALVEDWKLLEGVIDLTGYTDGQQLTLNLSGNQSGVYVDDIRIHPQDAQMKTYAYDDQTMRLMAEIDENGFATFYEYDSEGLLVRVKKETERGIMTIKESRSVYKKATP